jgi:hypothetical protein
MLDEQSLNHIEIALDSRKSQPIFVEVGNELSLCLDQVGKRDFESSVTPP